MTTDTSRHPRPKRLPRRGDGRRSTFLKELLLIGGLGLVLNDRRSHRERRRSPGTWALPPPCALLCQPEETATKGRRLASIGFWIKRHLGYPWQD